MELSYDPVVFSTDFFVIMSRYENIDYNSAIADIAFPKSSWLLRLPRVGAVANTLGI